MRFALKTSDMAYVGGDARSRRSRGAVRASLLPAAASRSVAAFTLVEVLAALMFMAIVVPVAVEALHLASVSGEIAVRKADAARIADAVLNENIITTNWNRALSGTVQQRGHTFRWTMRSEAWPADNDLQLVTADVTFSAQGRDYSVSLSTLANPLAQGSLTGMLP
jgi:hypothetical protein